MNDEDLRQHRLEKTRAILRNEKFRAMAPVDRNDILNGLIAKGLTLDDLKMLIKEALQERQSIKSSIVSVNTAYLQNLPYDVFLSVVTEGKIAGADLIHLCNSSQVLTEYCERSRVINEKEQPQFLFRQLLRKMGKSIGPRDNARELYKYHTIRVPFLFNNIARKLKICDKFQRLLMTSAGYAVIPNIYPKNLYEFLYERVILGLLAISGGLRDDLNGNYTITRLESHIRAMLDENIARKKLSRNIYDDPEYIGLQDMLKSIIASSYPVDDHSLGGIIGQNIQYIKRQLHLSSSLIDRWQTILNFRNALTGANNAIIADAETVDYSDIIEGMRKFGYNEFDTIMSTADNYNLADSLPPEQVKPMIRRMIIEYNRSNEILWFTSEELSFIISLHRRFLSGELQLADAFSLSALQ